MSLYELRLQQERRHRLRTLAIACAVALALVGLARTELDDIAIAGASAPSYVDYCHSSPERHEWCQWQAWMADDRNRAWFAIEQHFGTGHLGSQAKRVADCESHFEPRALNPRSGAAGVFQVMPQWAERYEQVTGQPYYDGRFDPDANARFSRWLVNETGGWSHWSCKP